MNKRNEKNSSEILEEWCLWRRAKLGQELNQFTHAHDQIGIKPKCGSVSSSLSAAILCINVWIGRFLYDAHYDYCNMVLPSFLLPSLSCYCFVNWIGRKISSWWTACVRTDMSRESTMRRPRLNSIQVRVRNHNIRYCRLTVVVIVWRVRRN